MTKKISKLTNTPEDNNPFSFDGIDIDAIQPSKDEKISKFSFGPSNVTDYPSQLYEIVDDTTNGPKFNIDQAYDEGINLNAFLEDPKEPITDLNWLIYPNVRENPTETAHIRDELHRQWIDKKPYKRMDYKQHDPAPAVPNLPKISLREVLQKAVRMASEGVSEAVICEYLEPISGLDAVQKTLRIINNEKDLLGRLFIRASVYPDCHKGEWKDKVKSCNKTARFIISAKKCRGCYQNRGGRCEVFKKDVVDLLPWANALRWYEQIFAEHGIQAVGNTTEEKVMSLFRAVPYTPKTPTNYFPVDYMPTVSLEEAVNEIAEYKDKRRVVDISYRNEMKEYENAVSYLDGLKNCRMITPEEYESILSSSESPVVMMLKARDIVLKAKEIGLYSGPGYEALLHQFGDHTEEEMMAFLATMDNKQVVLDNSHLIVEENKKRALDQIKKWVKNKMLTTEQAKAILALDLSPTDTILLGKNTILTKGETPTYYGYGSDMIQDPASLVSLDQAWRDLANFKNTQQVIDLSYRNKEKEVKEIKDNLQRWKQTGLLSKMACDFLSDNIGKRPKHEIFAKAAEIINKNVVQIREYKGSGENALLKKVATSQQVIDELRNLEITSKREQAILEKAVTDRKREGLLKYISDMTGRGVIKTASSDKLNALVRITSDLKKAFELVSSLVRMELNSPHRPEMKEIEKRDYDGEGIYPELELSLEDAVHNVEYTDDRSSYTSQEVSKAEFKLIDLMNKGLFGSALADELSALGISEIIDNVPRLYEYLQMFDGFVGKIVLDPEPYFTATLDGCKDGAKKLKRSSASQIMQKEKCAGCVQNRGDFCNIYGRKFITKDMEDHRLELIERGSKSKESKYVAELDPSLKNDWNTFVKPSE